MGSTLSFIAMLISLAGLTYCNIMKLYALKIFFKTLTSLLFLVIAYVTLKTYSKHKTTTYFKLMFLGLVLFLFGDVFLAVTGDSKGLFFILGVVSCAFAHVFYLIAFFQFGKCEKLTALWFCFFYIILIGLISIPNIFDFAGLKPLIMGYAALLSFMVAKSLSLWKYRKENPYFVNLTIAGALLFLISDSLLLFSTFGHGALYYIIVISNIIYYIGQALIGLSFKNELILKKN